MEEQTAFLVFILVAAVVGFALWFDNARTRSRRVRRTDHRTRHIEPLNNVFEIHHSQKVHAPQRVTGRARIVDGDTIVINKTQIRLFGIDAPELNHPFGQKAKWALVHMCKGKEVTASITDRDDYGRVVARCTLADGRDLSAEMVKVGLAIDWPKFSGGCYSRLEVAGVRKRLWLADARQKGRMQVWKKFEERSKKP